MDALLESERRRDPDVRCLPEKGVGKNNIGNGKIMAGAGAIEDTAGEKQKLGVLRHFVCLQINFYVGFSATAMKNRCVC